MVLTLECFGAQRARILSFITVDQLMLGQCTGVVECLLTHKTLNYWPAASATCRRATTSSQCPRLVSLHASRFCCWRW